MNFEMIIKDLKQYYNEKINTHGSTAMGVDWNSKQSQELRFEQLFKVCDTASKFSINDYGCGYGALVNFLIDKGCQFQYSGFDIVENMVVKARELNKDVKFCKFFTEKTLLTVADYTVASGLFNAKLQVSNEQWTEYVLHTLRKINKLSKKGFAFNMLTKYSDSDYMRSDLYYAAPCVFFDYCMTKFSRNVSLLHDYGLYDFTIIVRK